MRPSLERIGRFYEQRARQRLLAARPVLHAARMILLPALLLSLLFALAVCRLCTIPLRLMRGALRLQARRRRL